MLYLWESLLGYYILSSIAGCPVNVYFKPFVLRQSTVYIIMFFRDFGYYERNESYKMYKKVNSLCSIKNHRCLFYMWALQDQWLLHSVLMLIQSWIEPLVYLQTTLDRYDDAPDLLLNKTKWLSEKLLSLEQGVLVLITKVCTFKLFKKCMVYIKP